MPQFCLTVFSIVLLACGDSPAPPAGRVLFIGNSLTYANDLPGMVSALADSAGAGPMTTESVVAGNYSLGDHLDAGNALSAIKRGGWEVVVLQQGPSSLDESRADLIASTRRFDAEIRKIGGRTALYAVWPEKARLGVFDWVSESYRLAAQDVKGIYLPAGEGWRAAWRSDAALALYDLDDFHPSVDGTYVAALVIYARLSGRTPVGLPSRLQTRDGTVVNIPAARARILQLAAEEANARNPANP